MARIIWLKMFLRKHVETCLLSLSKNKYWKQIFREKKKKKQPAAFGLDVFFENSHTEFCCQKAQVLDHLLPRLKERLFSQRFWTKAPQSQDFHPTIQQNQRVLMENYPTILTWFFRNQLVRNRMQQAPLSFQYKSGEKGPPMSFQKQLHQQAKPSKKKPWNTLQGTYSKNVLYIKITLPFSIVLPFLNESPFQKETSPQHSNPGTYAVYSTWAELTSKRFVGVKKDLSQHPTTSVFWWFICLSFQKAPVVGGSSKACLIGG